MKSLYDIPENQATLNSNGSRLCLQFQCIVHFLYAHLYRINSMFLQFLENFHSSMKSIQEIYENLAPIPQIHMILQYVQNTKFLCVKHTALPMISCCVLQMLERYKDSLSDLVHLLKVDPKNTAAQREIEVVKDYWRKVQIMYIFTKEKREKS